MIVPILISILLSLAVYLWHKLTTKPANFPPGPPRVPMLGSVTHMKNPWSSQPSLFWGVYQLQKRYGDTFGIYLGNMPAVVLAKYEDIKEVLGSEDAASRPPTYPNDIRTGWEHPEKADPVMNKDRSPGVILSNVS